jgi:hypothetical protein
MAGRYPPAGSFGHDGCGAVATGCPMTMTKPDPVGTTAPDVAELAVEGHPYTWYDPDSAAFDRADALVEHDPGEDDEAPTFDWG